MYSDTGWYTWNFTNSEYIFLRWLDYCHITRYVKKQWYLEQIEAYRMTQYKIWGRVKKKLVSSSILTLSNWPKMISSFFSCKTHWLPLWLDLVLHMVVQIGKKRVETFLSISFLTQILNFCSYGCKQFEDNTGPQNTIVWSVVHISKILALLLDQDKKVEGLKENAVPTEFPNFHTHLQRKTKVTQEKIARGTFRTCITIKIKKAN